MFNKVLLGVSGTAIAVGGGVGAYLYLNKDEESSKIEKVSISELLKKEKYTPLTDSNSRDWSTILESYKTVIEKDSALAFSEFNGQGNSALETLKERCSNALKSKNEQLLNKAKKWCVKPVSAKDLLTAKGITVLKSEGNGHDSESEQTKWKARIAEFKAEKAKNTGLAQLISISDDTGADTANIQSIKTKCKDFGEVVSHKEKFEENLNNLKMWCIDK